MDSLTKDDVNLLIGHAEMLRLSGKSDMPLALIDIARRIALALGDTEAAQFCADYRAIPPPTKD